MNKRVRMFALGAAAALVVGAVYVAPAEAGGRHGRGRGYSYSYSRSFHSFGGPRFVPARPCSPPPRFYCPPRRTWNDCGPRFAPVRRSAGFSFGYSRGGWGRSNRCGW
jgi:hypothetical protein